MINITASAEDSVYSIIMVGHATGSETVCAACSAIAFALLGWAVNAERQGEIEIMENEIASGLMKLKYRAPTNRDAAEAVYNMAMIGFMQVEKAEPGRVRVAN